MLTDLLTRKDMQAFKGELLQEIRSLLQPSESEPAWMRSSEVQKLLKCSTGTLQNLRASGVLPFTKVGGTIYYSFNDVKSLLEGSGGSTE